VNPVSAPGGMVDAQARIAAIRSRLHQFAPTNAAGTFALDVTPASGTTGTPTPVSATAAALPPPAAPATAAATRAVPSAAASGAPSAAAARLEQLLPEAGKRWAGPIAQAASKHGVDPGLLAALVKHESGFDPNVRSHAGAIGLGQLMPGTAAGLGVDPTDPIQNLDGAARYLKQQMDRFGSADLALAAYNAGPNRVAQAGGIPNITETRTYVGRVLKTWEQYR
jgi:soluble lytic murein transglycosylase-like protein